MDILYTFASNRVVCVDDSCKQEIIRWVGIRLSVINYIDKPNETVNEYENVLSKGIPFNSKSVEI